MILTGWHGSETAREAKAAIRMFWVPTNSRPGVETAMSMMARSPSSGVSLVRTDGPFKAAEGALVDLGEWRQHTLNVADGVLFKLHFNRKRSWNTMEVHAGMYCLAREEAALQRVTVELSGGSHMRFTSHEITGRFDILTYDDAATLGAAVKPQFKKTFDQVLVRRACKIEELEPEVSPRIRLRVREVVSSAGITQVVIPQRRRSLGIR